MTEEKQKGVSADRKNSGKADVKKDGKIESLSAEIERDIMAGKLGPSGARFGLRGCWLKNTVCLW